MRRLTAPILLFAIFVVSLSGNAHAKRVALVIGNDAYENVPELQKAVNDAAAMETALSGIGFSVIKAENVSRREMNAQLQLFASKLDPGDEALFYFAGHGIEIDGRNFLLPVDVPKAEPGQEDFVQSEAVDADRILTMIRNRGARVSILVLDACRENPFPSVGARTVGASRGLARMPTPDGTFIMYSADAGQTALDRLSDNDPDPNSVYTRSLIPLLTRPGLSLPALARDVRGAVQKLARGVSHDQRPAYYDAITGDFYFAGKGEETQAGGAASAAAPSGENAVELAFWNSVQNSENPAASQEYLARYPSGVFAGLAKIRLESLKRPAEQKLAALPPADAPSAGANIPITDCDRLAASEYDPLKVASAVPFDLIDAAKAIAACREAMDRDPGNPRFSYQLARALQKSGDHQEAVRLYKSLSEQDYAAAMLDLGVLYTDGEGVAANSDEAARLYRKAAELGHPIGMYRLAAMYGSGRGVTRDDAEALRWLRQAADLGFSEAMTMLGIYYDSGTGVDQNAAEAMNWYRKASELGNAHGMFRLARMYGSGHGVTRDDAQAFLWLRKAADLGFSEAITAVGIYYDTGTGVNQNAAEAVNWHRKSAELGNGTGMFNLANSYMKGSGVAKDDAEAARWFHKSAELGDSDAMTALGLLYDQGTGVSQNGAEAVNWYRKAAELGNAAGMYNLAVNYANGSGVARDDAEAARWFRKSAELGNSSAMLQIGVAFSQGYGVPASHSDAVHWWDRAAHAGNASAMWRLGNVYLTGLGVSKDTEKALNWYRKSAELGNATGMHNLAVLYAYGSGVAKDLVEAARWFRKAAEIGDSDSMLQLGQAFANGHGVSMDSEEAVRWYEKAAELGNPGAVHNLADHYARGDGVAKDPRIAATHMLRALKAKFEFSRRQMTETPDNWTAEFRRELLTLMKSEGLYDGPIDGKFGPGVRAAIERLTGE